MPRPQGDSRETSRRVREVNDRTSAFDLLARQMFCAVFLSISGHAKVGVGVRGFGDAAGLAAMESWRIVLGGFEFFPALPSFTFFA